jgi:hypothetical protein
MSQDCDASAFTDMYQAHEELKHGRTHARTLSRRMDMFQSDCVDTVKKCCTCCVIDGWETNWEMQPRHISLGLPTLVVTLDYMQNRFVAIITTQR